LEISDELAARIEALETRGWVCTHDQVSRSTPIIFSGPTFRNGIVEAAGMTMEKAVAQAEAKADWVESERAEISIRTGTLGA
jgi:hypothetical protein